MRAFNPEDSITQLKVKNAVTKSKKKSQNKSDKEEDKLTPNKRSLRVIQASATKSGHLQRIDWSQQEGKALVGQKRKRKTEIELRILRQELRKNVMWTRDSIKSLRKQYEDEFFMTEQQIYKWWWDQTRKRTKKSFKKAKHGEDC